MFFWSGCLVSLCFYPLIFLLKGLFLSGLLGMEQIKMIGFSCFGGGWQRPGFFMVFSHFMRDFHNDV